MSDLDPAAALDELLDPERVWGIRAAELRRFIAAAQRAVAGGAFPEPRTSRTSSQRGGTTATIAIRGPISRRPSLLTWLFGGTTTEQISAQLRAALEDDGIQRVVLEVDSPGGDVDGITELAAEIYAARSRKPITAFVYSAGSAAYWLASQAERVVVTPSGSVGSIGVFALHLDRSRELDKAGITPTFIASSASPYKTEENPLEPLSADAKAEIQRRVDTFAAQFIADVARGRGVSTATVASSYGQGRTLLAKDAVKVGMADRVGTTPLGGGSPQLAMAAAAAAAAAEATLGMLGEDLPPIARSSSAPQPGLAIVVAQAQALAAVVLAEESAQFDYVEIPWSEVRPMKAVIATAAVQVATRDLRLAKEPILEFFIPDDGRAEGARFSRKCDTGGETLDDGARIRVRADADMRRIVRIVGHELAHCAQSPAQTGDRERSALEYEARFESIYWRSPEAGMVNRWALGSPAA